MNHLQCSLESSLGLLPITARSSEELRLQVPRSGEGGEALLSAQMRLQHPTRKQIGSVMRPNGDLVMCRCIRLRVCVCFQASTFGILCHFAEHPRSFFSPGWKKMPSGTSRFPRPLALSHSRSLAAAPSESIQFNPIQSQPAPSRLLFRPVTSPHTRIYH